MYSVYIDGELRFSTDVLDDAYKYADGQMSKGAESATIWDNFCDEEVDSIS